jgi:hypothetical protein
MKPPFKIESELEFMEKSKIGKTIYLEILEKNSKQGTKP